VSGAESDADIIARKISGGTDPGDLEYSRYSDPTIGPFNAMSQLSAMISERQQEYGPEDERIDRLRRGQLQGGLADLKEIQAAQNLAEVERGKDITGIQTLLTDRENQARSAQNRNRARMADARRAAVDQQERAEATRSMTEGQVEDLAFKRDATGKSQLEEYRDATNRRADAALFTLAGDELRKAGRDQRFGHIASEVGGIRGDALTATQKIQTYLLDEERKDIDKLFESETLANKVTGESQKALLDVQKTTDDDIIRIGEKVLDARGVSEKEVRAIEKALRDDDIEQLRLLLTTQRGITDFPLTLAQEARARETDPLIADFERMSRILPSEAARLGSRSLGAEAAQSNTTYENIMKQVGSPAEAQEIKRLRDRAIQQKWDIIEGSQDTRLSSEQEAEQAAEMAKSKEAYDLQLQVIEAWRVVSAQMLPGENPLEVSRRVTQAVPRSEEP
jgi:hypothetical protein